MSSLVELNSKHKFIRNLNGTQSEFYEWSADVFGCRSSSFTYVIGLDVASLVTPVTIEDVSIITFVSGIYSQTIPAFLFAFSLRC